MRYQFYTCDVFTDQRFGGNPLAVFPDATGLTAEQMQQITGSSTTLRVRLFPAEQGHAQVRIFTPTIKCLLQVIPMWARRSH